MIELTLPYPPSVNTYWRTWQGRIIVSSPGRKYREAVMTHCSQQGIRPMLGRLHLAAWVHPPDRRRRDLDNVLKALLDLRGNQRITDQSPEDKIQTLEKYGKDLTALARQGKIDPVIGAMTRSAA